MTNGSVGWMVAMAMAVVCAAAVLGQEAYSPADLERAVKLHRRALVLDTHSDVTPKLEDPAWNFAERHPSGHMDIPRLRDAGFGCQFFSIWMGETPGEGRAIRKALVRIDALYEAVRLHGDALEMASTAADVRRIRAAGKIACLMGIEGGHIIEDSLPALRMFYRLGCRYMTLTHSFNTTWADSAGIDDNVKPQFGGLSPRGEEIVREMNRLGMMVDISHVSRETFDAALRVSSAPVIASHSSCRAICDHRRNLTDEQLLAVKKNGGVVQINFFEGFLDPQYDARRKEWSARHKAELDAIAAKFKANLPAQDDARRELERQDPLPRTKLVVLAQHVEHAAKIMGWDHVGIGADWDGISGLPEGIDHCGDLPKLTALLLARGAREEDLEKWLGLNLLRVLAACERH